MPDHGAMTALEVARVFHSEYSDGIALTSNNAHHLQLQLDRFHTYKGYKGYKGKKASVKMFDC